MAERKTLYQTIYHHLKRQIESGELQPGDKIATEREVMETFGVSRVTTTRALQLLQSENLISRLPGRGSYVLGSAQPSPLLEEPLGPTRVTDGVESTVSFETKDRPECPPQVIGFVAPFLHYSFGPTILATLEEEVTKQDGVLAVRCSYGDQALEEEAIRKLLAAGAKGVIIFPVNGEFYNPLILQLHLQEFPMVVIDKFLPGIPLSCVTTDNRQAAYALTQQLLQLGHRHIGYFSPKIEGTSTLSERYEGFLEALTEEDVAFGPDYFIEPISWATNSAVEDERQIEQLKIWLDRNPELSAVFASDDQLAQCMLATVRRLGLEVPKDFSIVCFDGPPVNLLFWSFTAALQDESVMAKQAMDLLVAKLRGDAKDAQRSVVIPAKIHLGQSTGTVRSSSRRSEVSMAPS